MFYLELSFLLEIRKFISYLVEKKRNNEFTKK